MTITLTSDLSVEEFKKQVRKFLKEISEIPKWEQFSLFDDLFDEDVGYINPLPHEMENGFITAPQKAL